MGQTTSTVHGESGFGLADLHRLEYPAFSVSLNRNPPKLWLGRFALTFAESDPGCVEVIHRSCIWAASNRVSVAALEACFWKGNAVLEETTRRRPTYRNPQSWLAESLKPHLPRNTSKADQNVVEKRKFGVLFG